MPIERQMESSDKGKTTTSALEVLLPRAKEVFVIKEKKVRKKDASVPAQELAFGAP